MPRPFLPILVPVAVAASLVGVPLRAAVCQTTLPEEVQLRSDTINRWLPEGTFRVTILDHVAPPRLQQLIQAFQAAAQQNPEWWVSYVRENAQPGKPLPYHPNIGVSETEYREMLKLFEEVRLTPVADAELTVRWLEPTRAVLEGGDHLPELTGVELDLVQNAVRTPYGTTSTSSRIQPSERQRATGSWSGLSWKLESLDEASENGTMINFSIGRLQASGRGILHYDVRRLTGGELTTRVTRVLTYDLGT